MSATLPRSAWWLIAAAVAILWFTGLDVRKLQHPDEGRYAEIAREMVVTGDWVTPRLNDLKYFEKPPMQYWLTASAYQAFGIDEWTARIVPALGGLLAILAVGFTLARLETPLAGAFAALALAGTVWHAGLSHVLTLDALLNGFLALALCAFLLAQRDGLAQRAERGWMLVMYAALAAATLTKGLVALMIPGGALVLYTLATRDVGPWRRLHLVPGLALYAVLTVPWFVLVSNANPEFARFFFIHEHFQRFLTQEHRREGAWWYFIPIFVVGLLPWLVLFAWSLPASWRAAANGRGFSWQKLCLCWSAFLFVFFSASGSKLPSYILPLFPALALVIGWQLARLPGRTLFWLTLPVALATLAIFGVTLFGAERLAATYADPLVGTALYLRFARWMQLAFAVFVAGGAVAGVLLWRGTARARAVAIAAMTLVTLGGLQIAFLGHDVFRQTRSAFGILSDAENANGGPLDPQAPMYQVSMYDQTFPFYLGRTTTIVAFRDELALGLDAEPQKAFADLPGWIGAWTALPGQGYALMHVGTYNEMTARGLPLRVLARDPRRVLVARR
jgi:4-amino-4-deoxy-L-arabinose transferase-like glycosyltransferase